MEIKNLISFVIPCYRSEKTIESVINEIIETVHQKAEYDYEIICVNDSSPDNVLQVLKRLASRNHQIKVINFAKNMGKHAAVLAGHGVVRGEYVVDLDDDMQSPVYELWNLLAPIMNDECDAVTAKYYEKKESRFKRFGSDVNKLMTETLLDKPKGIRLENLYAMRRFVSDEMIKYKSPYPYIEGLIFRVTNKVKVVEMEQRERGDDQATGFTFKKSFSLLMNGLTAFSVKPLRIASIFGLLFAIAGFLGIIYIFIGRLVTHTIYIWGYASLMAVLLLVSGLVMLMLGLIGEYIGRIYICINASPQYVIKEMINFEEVDEETIN